MDKVKIKKTTAESISFEMQKFTGSSMPVAIGVEGADGIMIPLIERGADLPASYSRIFTTSESFQISFYFQLYLGERPFAADNTQLCILRHDEGSFTSAGKPQYKLNIKISKNGLIIIRSQNLNRNGKGQPQITFQKISFQSSEIDEINDAAARNKKSDIVLLDKYKKLCFARDRCNYIQHECWPAAKQKMSLLEKHNYKKCRHQIENTINLGPRTFNASNAQNLKRLLSELSEWSSLMNDRSNKALSCHK